ncbi:MAG: ABC transporter permease subunit [Eubacteriales bacterium]|nr:ABC transporter permease subunit [Eubacteriales bacterium]
MTVFRYELKRMRKNIVIWALSMGGAIFLMLPTYIGFTKGSDGVMVDAMQNNPLFELLGVGATFIMTPLGMFSFLGSFASVAAAIYGMGTAFSMHSKEYENKSVDFLFTKPAGRKAAFWGKLSACAVGCVIIGLAYSAGAAAALLTLPDITVDWWTFLLLAKTLTLIELIFVVFGTVAGTYFSNTRTPVLLSSCVMLVLFTLATMSRKISQPLLSYLTPFAFFPPLQVAETRFYDWKFMIWYVVLSAGLILLSYRKFLKKDITFGG